MAAERFRVLYDGSPDIAALKGRLQRGGCPLIEIEDEGEIVVASYPAIGDSGRLDGKLALMEARVEALLQRARSGVRSPLPDRPQRLPVRFSRALASKHALRRLAGKLLSPLRRRDVRRHWNLAVRRGDPPADLGHFDIGDYTPLPVDPTTFYADPFLSRHYLFAEACPYATGKGVIVCAQIGADGLPGPWRIVLERPWHLSYPFVFEHDGETWLAPESSSHGGIELYRATDFPYGWTFAERLLPELSLVDPTFFEHDGRLWLFAGMATPGGSDWDELHAWHAPALTGPWEPHALNPIKSDCRSARPAGRILKRDGRLIRPAQRCERAYGEALAWLEIRQLTPDMFEEVEIASWRAHGAGMSGPHHAELADGVSVVDFRSLLNAS